MARPRAPRLWAALLLVLAVLAALIALPGSSPASGCTVTWVGDVTPGLDGGWREGTDGVDTNWSDNSFPDANDHVCLNNLGTPYTVSLTTTEVIDHYTFQSQATLTINAAILRAEADSTNAGTVNLTGGGAQLATANFVDTNTETLTNTGTIAYSGTGSPEYLIGDVSNQGTISVAHPDVRFDVVYDNGRLTKLTNTSTGTITLASGGLLNVLSGATVANTGGGIGGTGTMTLLQDGTKLQFTSGSIAPTADVNLTQSSDLDFVGASTGASAPSGKVRLFGYTPTLSGDVPSGITLRADAATQLIARASWTNAGTIIFDATNSELATTDVNAATTETLTNTGTINFNGPGVQALSGDVANQGTISVASTEFHFQDRFDGGRVPKFTNANTLTLTSGASMLVIDGAAFEQGANATINGAGALSTYTTTGNPAGPVRILGGTIAPATDVNVISSLQFVGATNATGNVDITSGGCLMTGDVPQNFSIDIVPGGQLHPTASFTNAGTINLTGGGSVLATSDNNAATTETMTNTGTIASSGTGGGQVLGGDVVNQGTVSLAHPDLFFEAWFEARTPTFTNSTTLTLASGALMRVVDGATFVQGPDATINGPGTLSTYATTSNPVGPVRILGGTIAPETDVNVISSLQFGSAADAVGNVDVTSGGVLMTGDVPEDFSIDIVPGGQLHPTASFTNAGTINLTGPGSVLATSDGNFATTETMTNTGLIASSGTAGSGQVLGGDVVNQGGTISVTEADLHFQSWFEGRTPQFTNAGIMTFSNAGRMQIVDGPLFIQNPGGAINGTGTLNTLTTTGNAAGPVQISGGSIGGNVDFRLQSGSELRFVGAAGATGNVDAASADHQMTGNVPPGFSIDILAGVRLRALASFINAGTITLMDDGAQLITENGVASDTETLTNTGTISAISVSGFSSGPEGVSGDIVNQGAISVAHPDLRFQSIVDGRVPKLTNTGLGSVTVNAGAKMTTTSAQVFTTAGFVQVAGRLLTKGYIQTAGTSSLVGGPAEISATAGQAFSLQDGTLSGNGTVTGNLTNGGTVSPGTSSTPGTLALAGNYTQEAGGVLTARVRSGGNDRLNVSGTATLGGTLSINTSGFTPPEGQTYTVLTGAPRSGQFGTVTGASSGPYDVVYDPTSVKLLAKAQPQQQDTTVSIDNPSVRNPDSGDATLIFTVKLSRPSVGGVAVGYATANGSAQAPDDYEPASGTLVFGAGESEKTVAVTVHASRAGRDRTLQVRLTNPVAVSIGDGQGIGTILNDSLELRSILPNSGGAGGVTTVTLHGNGFVGDPTVKLVRGEEQMVGTDVAPSSDGRTLRATFNIPSTAVGEWDVVAELPRFGTSATLPDGFTVEETAEPSVQVTLNGPGAVLDGNPWTGFMRLTNVGNVDATNTLVRIDGFQSGAGVEVLGGGASVQGIGNDGARSIVILVERLPAGATKTLAIRFHPRGEGHDVYYMRPYVIENSAPDDGAPEPDPTLRTSARVLSGSGRDQTGVVSVAGDSANGDIDYSLRVQPGRRGPASITRSESGDSVHFHLELALPGQATGPPGDFEFGPRRLSAARVSVPPTDNAVLDFETSKAVLDAIKADPALRYLLKDRKKLAECLHKCALLDSKEQEKAEKLADGDGSMPLLNLLAEALDNPLVSGVADVLAGAFEDQLVGGDGSVGVDYAQSVGFGPPLSPSSVLDLFRERCDPPKPPRPPPTPFEVRVSGDPNDKTGPAGFGEGHHIGLGVPLEYNIRFENIPNASAPAHEVRITDQLDPAKVELSTLELGPVYFGVDKFASPPPGSQSWNEQIDLRPAKNLVVDVNAGLDPGTGVLSWRFRSLNPSTGELETDPDLGFLPPDKVPPEGQGGVSFKVAQRAGLQHGDRIENGATIVFDFNEPIKTPVFANTIDTSRPASGVRSAKAKRGSCRSLTLGWSGKDTGAGVRFYDIYVSRNGASYAPLRVKTNLRKATYSTLQDGAYAFYTVATDGAGNLERASAGVWDQLVRSVVKRGRRLVIRLNKSAARKLGVTSAQIRAGKRKTAVKRGIPASLTLDGLRTGGYNLELVAQTKQGRKRATLRAKRTVAICQKVKSR